MKKNNIINKIIGISIIMMLCVLSVFSENITMNETNNGLGSFQVDDNSPLYIDFSNDSTTLFFIVIYIILFISFIFKINLVNSLILLIISITLMANGFNWLLSFINMLISILFIVYANNNNK